jgi:Dna[CI] antecedent DciA-like protein
MSRQSMERASKLIRQLRLPADALTPEELACAAWPGSVGKITAAHTRAVRLVRTRLVVEVEDRTWQRQLFSLSRLILVNLEKSIGPGIVDDLEFRIMPRRIEPQRAVRAWSGSPHDEADMIEDPVLRGIYRSARKKAQA